MTKKGRTLIIVLVSIIGGFIVIYPLLQFAFFAIAVLTSEENTVQKTWNVEEYKIDLVSNIAWAGPRNYRYILYEDGDRIGISYSGTLLTDDDSCRVEFKPGDGYGSKNNYVWDRCREDIEKATE